MTIKPSAEEVKKLEEDLAKNPRDTDIMNALALGYFSNPSLLKGKEDLELMEKAYATKKTIKSTHNLAWFYYLECWGSLEKALGIQKECISMQPKSFYPYFLYGYMLIADNQSLEAIENLEIAYSKHKSREIIHNLGTAYAKSGNFNVAKNYLIEVANDKDIENKSKYNLAIVKIQLVEKEDALKIIKELEKQIDKYDDIDSFAVAYLYYILEDYDTAYSCCKMADWNIYDLFSWEHVPYLIYKNDIEEFKKLVASEIEDKKNWIIENKDNDEFWEDDTEEEKQQYLTECESEITRLTNLEAEFALNKPNIDINNQYLLESCGCLLFGCSEHNNLKCDE
ncbi:MAG: hypothetical protein AAF349_13770 [Cyanobacteria bacterium P01_A01_bin.68]